MINFNISAEKIEKKGAYNAAGRALMSALLDLPFEKISIENGVEMVLPNERSSANEADVAAGKVDVREAMCSVAGLAAEELFFDTVMETAPTTWCHDIALICLPCRSANTTGGTRNKELFPCELIDSLASAFALHAREILKIKWRKLEKTAEALHRKRSLSYEDVKKILASH